MYTLLSTQSRPRIYNTLCEAKVVKGKEYNLYLASMLEKNISANPVRENTDCLAYIVDGGNLIEWKIIEGGLLCEKN